MEKPLKEMLEQQDKDLFPPPKRKRRKVLRKVHKRGKAKSNHSIVSFADPERLDKALLLVNRISRDPKALIREMDKCEGEVRAQLPEIYRHIANMALAFNDPSRVIPCARFLAERFDPEMKPGNEGGGKEKARALIELLKQSKGKGFNPKSLSLKQVEQEVVIDLEHQRESTISPKTSGSNEIAPLPGTPWVSPKLPINRISIDTISSQVSDPKEGVTGLTGPDTTESMSVGEKVPGEEESLGGVD